jgi:sugar phosphate isomerase/epimerase
MKIGISRPTRNLEEARAMLGLAQQFGFEGVQFKPNQYGNANGPLTADEFQAAYGDRAGMVRAGLIIYCRPNLAEWEGQVFPVARFASEVGAPHLCICAGVPKEAAANSGHARAATMLNTLGAEGKRRGVHVSLHNHANSLFESADDLLRMVDLLDPELCGVTLDTAHLAKGGHTDAASLIPRLRSHLWNVHLKDLDESSRFRPLGRGTLALRSVLEALGTIDYQQWIIVDDESREVGVEEAFAASREFLDNAHV